MNNDTIVIELDKSRTLKFRRKELKMLEKTLGKTLAKIDFENMNIDTLTKMIHLGLIHEDQDLKFEVVEELLDNADLTFGEMVKLTMEAFSIAMGGGKMPDSGPHGDEVKN